MATNNPSNWNVTVFSSMVTRTLQLYGGRLRGLCQMATGDKFRADAVYPQFTGGGLPQKKTNRAATTPVKEFGFGNRRVLRDTFHDGIQVDRDDLSRMVADIKYHKTQALMDGFALREDIIIQQALLGTAKGGEKGETDVSFTAGNILSVTTGAATGYANAGFNYDKQVAAITLAGTKNVPLNRVRPTFILSSKQWKDMMNDERYTNFDYARNAVGETNAFTVPNFLGADFMIYEQVPFMNTAGTGFRIADTDLSATTGQWQDTDTTDIRACMMVIPNAAILEINPDIMVKEGEDPSRSFVDTVYVEAAYGAVRNLEDYSFVIPCDQSPAAV